MDYDAFLTRIIDDGIEAAKHDYNKPRDEKKLQGSIAGFEACRGKQPQEIVDLWTSAAKEAAIRMGSDDQEGHLHDSYWYWRCYGLEVEWVLNCLSVALKTSLLSHLPTARAVTKAAEVLGVAAVQ